MIDASPLTGRAEYARTYGTLAVVVDHRGMTYWINGKQVARVRALAWIIQHDPRLEDRLQIDPDDVSLDEGETWDPHVPDDPEFDMDVLETDAIVDFAARFVEHGVMLEAAAHGPLIVGFDRDDQQRLLRGYLRPGNDPTADELALPTRRVIGPHKGTHLLTDIGEVAAMHTAGFPGLPNMVARLAQRIDVDGQFVVSESMLVLPDERP